MHPELADDVELLPAAEGQGRAGPHHRRSAGERAATGGPPAEESQSGFELPPTDLLDAPPPMFRVLQVDAVGAHVVGEYVVDHLNPA